MQTKVLLICVLVASVLLTSGCAGLASGARDDQPAPAEPVTPEAPEATPGTPETPAGQLVLPKPIEHTGLTQEEWEQAVQIALTLPELSEWLEKGLPYRTEPRWFYKRPGSTIWRQSTRYISPGTPNTTEITPGVLVSIGSPQQILFSIAIDLASEKTVTFVRYDDSRNLPASQFNLRYLTEEEFAELFRIASEATGASIDPAKVEPYWMGISSGGWKSVHDYDAVEKGVIDVVGVPGATFYPAINTEHYQVIIDLENRTALEVNKLPPPRILPTKS